MTDQFFRRTYDAKNYNCAHFVSEVYRHETGRDITNLLKGFLLPAGERVIEPAVLRRFTRLERPENNCLVVMHRPRTSPHVGLFLRGKVLHLTETSGVQFMPLEIATLGFTSIRFYSC
jgi:hypothetical protein